MDPEVLQAGQFGVLQQYGQMAEERQRQQVDDAAVQQQTDMQTQMAEAKNTQQMEDSAVQHYSGADRDG